MSIGSLKFVTSRVFLAGLLCVAFAIIGCDYNAQTAATHISYEHGDLEQAASIAHDQALRSLSDDKDHDKLLLQLEDGAIQRAAGHLDTSMQAFDRADSIYSVYEVGPNVRISQQISAVAINDTVIEYTGYCYDGIMLNTYKALDALELGNLDRMRVELNHASQRQTDAVEKYKKQIADAQNNQPQDANAQQFDVNQAQQDPGFQQSFQQSYADLNVQDLSAYSDYVNPFTVYLRGLFLTYAGVDSSDLEQGVTSMKKVAGLIKDNPYVAQDAVLADQMANGAPAPALTYVIFETGQAPLKDQIKLRFPLVLRGGQRGGTYQLLEIALPRLVIRPCELQQLTVQTSTGTYPTALVCNMDSVVEQEFKNELPGVVARAMISTAVKAISQYAIDRSTANSGNAFANVLTQTLTNVAVEASTQADRRTWKTLPKLFTIARLPTPSDRNLTLSFPNGLTIPVHVQDGTVNVVLVKNINEGVPPIIRQAKLK